MIKGNKDNLIDELFRQTELLNASINKLRSNGTALAAAERDYKTELAKEAFRLKDAGTAVTLIDKVVFGQKNVAELRYKRDVAEAVYTANQEHINATKVLIRVLEGQVDREWGRK